MIILALAVALTSPPQDTTVYGPTEVQERPQLLSAPASNYRQCLEDAGIRGIEGLEFVIDTTGHVEPGSVNVVQSVDPVLDSLAIFSVRGEAFRAARKNGSAVRVRVLQPLRYGTDGPPVAPGDSGVFAASCVDHRPAPVHVPPPRLPDEVVENGDTGTVVLSFRVDTAGHVLKKSVTKLSGSREFEGAAAGMLENRETTFEPGRLYGRSVATQVHMAFIFARGTCGGTEPRNPPGSDPEAIDAMVVKACAR